MSSPKYKIGTIFYDDSEIYQEYGIVIGYSNDTYDQDYHIRWVNRTELLNSYEDVHTVDNYELIYKA